MKVRGGEPKVVKNKIKNPTREDGAGGASRLLLASLSRTSTVLLLDKSSISISYWYLVWTFLLVDISERGQAWVKPFIVAFFTEGSEKEHGSSNSSWYFGPNFEMIAQLPAGLVERAHDMGVKTLTSSITYPLPEGGQSYVFFSGIIWLTLWCNDLVTF